MSAAQGALDELGSNALGKPSASKMESGSGPWKGKFSGREEYWEIKKDGPDSYWVGTNNSPF